MITQIPVDNKVAQYAYDRMKRRHKIEESNLHSDIVKAKFDYADNILVNLRNARPDLVIRWSYGEWITIYSKQFADKYSEMKEIASFNFVMNRIHMRRKGATKVSKVIICGKILTPERVIKYIERFGEK